jgi:PAS domain-containing protein
MFERNNIRNDDDLSKNLTEDSINVFDIYKNIFDEAPIGIAVFNSFGKYIKSNRIFLTILGEKQEDLQSVTIKDVFHFSPGSRSGKYF